MPQPPDWLAAVDAVPRAVVDVGTLLSTGADPLGTITGLTADLPPGTGLVIHAPFNPTPLRDLLTRQGFEIWGAESESGHWTVRVYRPSAAVAEPALPPDKARFWLENDGLMHIDTRTLPPPHPMLEVLRLIDQEPAGGELIAHLPRLPVHLLPELDDRGWRWTILSDDESGMTLHISRD